MRPVEIHKRAREVIRGFSKEVRIELGSALIKLQLGMTLGFPISRPMPSVFAGAYELRFRDASGIQRVFYYLDRKKRSWFSMRSSKRPRKRLCLKWRWDEIG